ncbi:MAG TPA: hypothetical protein VN758_00455 [Solirubrobacterales bacterium]|nr:hypothetical protein [Solirubrobacterales bacterium]
MSTTARKVFACPSIGCARTSDTPVYCRHGQPADIAVGNWMVPVDRDLLEDKIAEANAFDDEVAAAMLTLLAYAGSERREWIRKFELRTVGGAGKSVRAVDYAYKELVKSGDLEEGDGDRVRLRSSETTQRGER